MNDKKKEKERKKEIKKGRKKERRKSGSILSHAAHEILEFVEVDLSIAVLEKKKEFNQ